MNSNNQPIVHPTALVHDSAILGAGVVIGPFAVIEADVNIGERCRIEAHATIKRFTRMGTDNHVFECAILGGVPQDLKYRGQDSRLLIGERNIIREGVTIHRAATLGADTIIGNDNFLMAYCHVAHDCVLENHVIMANYVGLAGFVHVEDHAYISGGVAIHQFAQVGRYCMIGGNSKIPQDVLPFFLTDGVPGRVRGLNSIGLKKAGFTPQEMLDLKKAYRILFRKPISLREKLDLLGAIDSEHVRHLVSFIKASKRGFCRADRSNPS